MYVYVYIFIYTSTSNLTLAGLLDVMKVKKTRKTSPPKDFNDLGFFEVSRTRNATMAPTTRTQTTLKIK